MLGEATELAERFGWHELDLEDVLSKRQRPKIDEYPDYLFSVLHFPRYDKTIGRLNAAELDVFLGRDHVVTLPNVELLPVSRLFHRVEDDQRLRDDLFGKGSGSRVSVLAAAGIPPRRARQTTGPPPGGQPRQTGSRYQGSSRCAPGGLALFRRRPGPQRRPTGRPPPAWPRS